MAIDIQGDSYARMPQEFAHDLRIDLRPQQQCRAGMAQIVKANAGQIRLHKQLAHGVVRGARCTGAADRIGKDQIIIDPGRFPASRVALPVALGGRAAPEWSAVEVVSAGDCACFLAP